MRLEEQERERLATEATERQQKLEQERQAAAEQARLERERRIAAEKAQHEKQERERKAAEGKARQHKLEEERQAAAEQTRSQEERRLIEKEVYTDPETKLMWTMQDNGNDIDWHDANEHAGQLKLGGYSDWRLPTLDELERLYDPQNKSSNKIRKPFRLTNVWVWSSTKEGSGSAWLFDFTNGVRYHFPTHNSNDNRALCVRRSGK